MADDMQLVASTNIQVHLDGVLQTHVVAFNTNGGWVTVLRKSGDGEWTPDKLRGVVSASCDL